MYHFAFRWPTENKKWTKICIQRSALGHLRDQNMRILHRDSDGCGAHLHHTHNIFLDSEFSDNT